MPKTTDVIITAWGVPQDGDKQDHQPGSKVSLDPVRARELIQSGHAKPAPDTKPAARTPDPTPQNK